MDNEITQYNIIKQEDTIWYMFLSIILTALACVVIYTFSFRILPAFIEKSGLIDVKFVIGTIYSVLLLESNDSTTLRLISYGNTPLTVIIPLSLTFYFFTVREQKAASISLGSSIGYNKILYIFLIFSIFTLVYGFHLQSLSSQIQINNTTLSMSDSQYSRILIWLFISVISYITIVIAVIDLLRKLNTNWVIAHIIGKTSGRFVELTKTKSMSTRQYNSLHTSIEGIYQILHLCIEKNMDELYVNSIFRWNGIVRWWIRAQVDEVGQNCVDDKKEYYKQISSIYSAILKDHIALIMALHKSHKINYATTAIKNFFSFCPLTNRIHIHFLSSLYEFCLLMINVDINALRNVLEGMENLYKDSNLMIRVGILIIYKALLSKAIKSKDVKILSIVCYSMLSSIEKENEFYNDIEDELLQEIGESALIGAKDKKITDRDKQTNLYCVIYILFQSAVKSIELSHYECTGFLVKFLATNFDSTDLNLVLKEFIENKAVNNPYIQQRNYYNDINVDLYINSKIVSYFIDKLVVLLYAQQVYMIKDRVFLVKEIKEPIAKYYLNSKQLDYVIEKLECKEEKFGLLCLGELKDLLIRSDIFRLHELLSDRVKVMR
ncbi:hypothetical protein H1S01_17400 [Heliobacterium chlorum]|uniref:Uncharacterized protein n=1 Tax=Heliobacterium chlorum TaxID=2698 RepID=A0ABR7T790_HELCL|nr:hypothetical protein [Heliobacterium chlorum]MBC9786240.1 hypothetical protein [Heliobacterium chlorum]